MTLVSSALPERLYRVSRQRDPLAFTDWKYIEAGPGRWDDPKHEYRVIYTSRTTSGAFVEVLQDLQSHEDATEAFDKVEENDEGFPKDSLPDLDAAVIERLQNRYFSTLIGANPEDRVVDIIEPGTRRFLETHMRVRHVKIGDLLSSNYALTQNTSRVIFELESGRYCGLQSPSAEDHRSDNYTFFETGRETNTLRARLTLHETKHALEEQSAIVAAQKYVFGGPSEKIRP